MKVKRVVEETRDFPGLGAAIKRACESDDRSVAQLCRDADAGLSHQYWYQRDRYQVQPSEFIEWVDREVGA